MDLNGRRPSGKLKFKVDLYQDIMGKFFPVTEGKDEYRVRVDGKIEHVKYTAEGSKGKVVRSVRGKLAR